MVRLSLAPYDCGWPKRFEEIRTKLQSALGSRAACIEHIGSTSVPGLAAKPIIDVLLEGVRADDEPGHRMYRPATADVHAHVWSDPDEGRRHKVFRDWLPAHPDDRELYEHVKRLLCEREWADANDYADAKDAVIATIMRRARGEAADPRFENFADVITTYVAPRGRILEIGAGEGLLAQALSDRGYEVAALDPQLRSRFPVTLTTFEAFESMPASFDCIAMQLVLHHSSDLEATLNKVCRLLKTEGIVAIDDYGWERSDDPQFRAERSDLLTSEVMLGALRARFEHVYSADHAYQAGGAGSDRIAFTFVGRKR
jgi:GrpB-like predicted nucleotidyltransferase (UPF0157 family)